MRKLVIWWVGIVVVATAAAITIVSLTSNRVAENLSVQSIRLFENGQYQDSSHHFLWTSNAIAANSASDINAMFTCPIVSTEVFTFLSLRGQESEPDKGWQAYSPTAFYGNSKSVLTPNLKPSGFINGTPGAKYSRERGGDFSLGIACTHAQGKIVDTVSYRFISIAANTGDWVALPEPVINTAK